MGQLGDAERLPFANESFDAVTSDWGAMTFTDPYRSVPRRRASCGPGGLLAFSSSSPLGWLCSQPGVDVYVPDIALHRSYFELRLWETRTG